MTPGDAQGTSSAAAHSSGTGAGFAPTRWTWVMRARSSDTPVVREALEALCRAYWKPVYAFVRRRGHASHEAQDLTQEFFARLLAGDGLRRADPEKGRFRTFLLSAVKHFLANEWDKERSLKRGGDREFVPVRIGEDTDAVGVEPAGGQDPERAYDRQWALSVLDRVLARLEREHVDEGKGRVFAALQSTLTVGRADVPYAVVAATLGTSEGAVKVMVHRLRQRYRKVLREEVAATLEDSSRAEDELRQLFAALS